jgi:hypothetical protein
MFVADYVNTHKLEFTFLFFSIILVDEDGDNLMRWTSTGLSSGWMFNARTVRSTRILDLEELLSNGQYYLIY